MNINHFGAMLVAAMVTVLPAQANQDGGGKGGGVSERLLEQQQQQQEEEQIPEVVVPTESILDSLEEPAPAPNDPAALAARDFYSKVVTHLDSTIEQQRQKLKALDARIAGIDHKLAADFTDARAGDKTADDAIESARQALDGIPHTPTADAAANPPGLEDADLIDAAVTISVFQATAQSIKTLEAARADMAAAGKAFGATIN